MNKRVVFLCTLLLSVCSLWAVSLPTTSYNPTAFVAGYGPVTGSSLQNVPSFSYATFAANEDFSDCAELDQTSPTACPNCCTNKFSDCMVTNSYEECLPIQVACLDVCQVRSLPLGGELFALFLSFIYATSLYLKRRKDSK